MSVYLACFLSMLLLADAEVPRISSLRAPAAETPEFKRGEEVEIFPTAAGGDQQASPATTSSTQASQNAADRVAALQLSGTLQPNTRLLLIRYISGEFAKAVLSLPAGKDGLIVAVGKPVNGEQLERAVATHGAAVKPGENVIISALEFQQHQIVVDLNGGGRSKKRLRDRIHIELNGMPSSGQVTQTNPNGDGGPPGLIQGMGSTIYLEFSKPVPDVSPDDLKTLLSPYLDFNKQRSASVQWIDTLPPDIKKAIQDRQPILGMDREMVIAAVGKPDHKVRERDPDGNDIEDWIYGQPPSKTVFVRFTGDKVTSIKQFPK